MIYEHILNDDGFSYYVVSKQDGEKFTEKDLLEMNHTVVIISRSKKTVILEVKIS